MKYILSAALLALSSTAMAQTLPNDHDLKPSSPAQDLFSKYRGNAGQGTSWNAQLMQDASLPVSLFVHVTFYGSPHGRLSAEYANGERAFVTPHGSPEPYSCLDYYRDCNWSDAAYVNFTRESLAHADEDGNITVRVTAQTRSFPITVPASKIKALLDRRDHYIATRF